MQTNQTKFRETEIGLIPEGWEVLRLDDLISIKHRFAFKGQYFSDEETDKILLTPGNFQIGGGFNDSKLKYYKGEILEEYLLKEDDLVVTMTDLSKQADTLGYSALVPGNLDKQFLHNQRIGLVNIHSSKIDKFYLYWLMRSKNYRDWIIGSATGTTVKHTSPSRICSFESALPPVTEQQKIAEVLGALDDKIELNRKMNKTLESIGQAIFDKYFCHSERSEESLKPLSDFGQIICGKTPSKANSNYFGGDIPFIKIPDMHSQTFILDTEDSLTEDGKNSQVNKIIPAGSICVSCIATVGLVSMTVKESQTNQQINSIIPNKRELTYYLYFVLNNLKQDLKNKASGGSATLNLNTSTFSKIEILAPENSLFVEFDQKVRPIFEQILINMKQIETLSQIRDSLLPRLMSGKLRVK